MFIHYLIFVSVLILNFWLRATRTLSVKRIYLCIYLIGHNLLLAYNQFEYKANYYSTVFITLVQILLQVGPKCMSLKCYYGWDLYYVWVQLLH